MKKNKSDALKDESVVKESAAKADSGKKSFRWLTSKQKKYVLIGLCALCVVVFLFSAYKLISILNEYRVSRQSYDSLASAVSVINASPAQTDSGATVTDANVPTEFSPISVDFKKLKEINNEIVGWLYSPDTVINYPVMHCSDNMKYMDTLYNGEWNSSGSIFSDMLCQPDFSSYNTVLYGHNMNDGSMFASLAQYRNAGYYEKHPVMYLLTPEQDYKVELFSSYVTPYDSDTYTVEFSSVESFDKLVATMISQSDIKTDVKPASGERILTMSTCIYDYNDARYVVHGRLVPVNKKAE